MDINQHIIQGRLTDDPEVINTVSGDIARLRVATNRYYTDRVTGERLQRSAYHTVLVPGFLMDQIADARRGNTIFVSGFAEDYEYRNGQGEKRAVRQLVAESISLPMARPSEQRTHRPGHEPVRRPPPRSQSEGFGQRRSPPPQGDGREPRSAGTHAGGYQQRQQQARRAPAPPAYEEPRQAPQYEREAPARDEFANLAEHVAAYGGPHG